MNVSCQLNTTVELWWQWSKPLRQGQSQVTETTVAQWRQTNGHGATDIIFPFAWNISNSVCNGQQTCAKRGNRLWLSASQTSNNWKYTTERRTDITCWSVLNYTHANPMKKQDQLLYSKPNYYHTATNYPLAFLHDTDVLFIPPTRHVRFNPGVRRHAGKLCCQMFFHLSCDFTCR